MVTEQKSDTSPYKPHSYDTNPDRPTKEILLDIKQGSITTTGGPNFMGLILAPFAALLVKLANDAEKTSKRLVWLTWAIFALTFVLLLLTGYLVFDAYQSHPLGLK